MIIGCVKEIMPHEYRVGLIPPGARALIRDGHTVLVQQGAGVGSNFSDAEYIEAGAVLVADPAEIWAKADLVIKVKEPLPPEYGLLRKGQLLFTYLHLAAHRDLTEALMHSGITAIAYETIENAQGGLPLLTPMSEVAGKLAVQAGAVYLQQNNGGRGILLGGVPGVRPANVVILGGGVSGKNAARVAWGMGAAVTMLDVKYEILRWFDETYHGQIRTLYSNYENISKVVREADLVIGAVLLPGAAPPKLITREMLRTMRPGSVIVDIAVDQGGCIETTRATRYTDPTYVEEGVIHYCVANMPGGTPYTSTSALTSVTLPYAKLLARPDWRESLRRDPGFAKGVNVHSGQVTYRAVAEATGLPYTALESIL